MIQYYSLVTMVHYNTTKKAKLVSIILNLHYPSPRFDNETWCLIDANLEQNGAMLKD